MHAILSICEWRNQQLESQIQHQHPLHECARALDLDPQELAILLGVNTPSTNPT